MHSKIERVLEGPACSSLRLAVALILLLPFTVMGARAWPEISLPDTARPFDIGQRISINGEPFRMMGFLSPQQPEEIAAWFRQSLGSPLTETRLEGNYLLGRNRDGFYITVQLDRTESGTRGITAIGDLQTTAANVEVTRSTTERWINRLPAGSTIASQTTSEEDGVLSRQLVIFNRQSVSLNSSRLQEILLQERLELERETRADAKGDSSGRLLAFRGRNQEAIAMIWRTTDGRTTTVLSMTAKTNLRP